MQCMYCGVFLDKNRWLTHHLDKIHYKTTLCSCGKTHSIKVNSNFLSSGHDDWDGKGWIKKNMFDKIKLENNQKLETKVSSLFFKV